MTVEHFASLSIVDGVVVGFGEHVIADIIQNGLSQKIYTTPAFFDFKNSSVDYSLLFRLKDYGGVSMLWGGDCHLCNQRCYFCSRQKRGFGWRNPKIVWEELKLPHQMGIKKLYNTADTVAVNQSQLKLLAKSKPKELAEMKLKCFINATQVTDETAKLLQSLNSWAAIGIESCSRVDVAEKGGTSPESNYRAMEILARNKIPMILTFIMGLPGENRKSLEADAQKIIQLVREYRSSIYWITVSPLLITLGSRAFENCSKALEGNLPKRHLQEFYNPLALTEQYFEKFCLVGLDEVYKTIFDLKNELGKIAPEIIFDSKGLDPDKCNITI